MCGILFTNKPNIDEKRFIRSLNLMRHRGPDSMPQKWFYKGFKLGHTRLKILDMDDRSNQPFLSHDGKYVMVYNGEIYNFQELSLKYRIEQTTSSDTEVVLELYAIMGPKMLDLLNGMFSFVILDTTTDNIFVARDRLGIKPLYFSQVGSDLIIASEIASVLELLNKIEFDEIGIRQYRKLRTFFNGHTLYSNIKIFPAGHYMISGKMHRYWSLQQETQEPPDYDEINELITSAVDYRCISDVPVGSYLSGGLDSTIIAGLASKPHTWTIGFKRQNEFEWAKLAANNFGSIHTEVLIDEEEFIELARWMIQKKKEPLSAPNEVLLYKMTKEVKEKNTVILSGEGADELFFGYDKIFRWAENNNWDIKQFDKYYSYGSHDDLEIIEYVLSPFLHHKKAIDIVAYFFQISHLHGLLRRLDNATMLCSVEARVPFVDHRLIERMAGVSFEFRMQNGVVKSPLKQIFKDIIPKEIIARAKIGFPVPLDTIPFGRIAEGQNPMDRWLDFNLNVLTTGSWCHQDMK